MKKNNKLTLVLFCGLPGSGKTTLAKNLEKQGKGIRICTDDWQEDLEMSLNADNFHVKLRNRLYAHTLELLSHGQSVILEDGLWMKKEREEKLADARRCGANAELHVFDLTFEETWDRLNSRNQSLPRGAVHIKKEDLQSCWDQFEKPLPDELNCFDSVFIYNDESKNPDN